MKAKLIPKCLHQMQIEVMMPSWEMIKSQVDARSHSLGLLGGLHKDTSSREECQLLSMDKCPYQLEYFNWIRSLKTSQDMVPIGDSPIDVTTLGYHVHSTGPNLFRFQWLKLQQHTSHYSSCEEWWLLLYVLWRLGDWTVGTRQGCSEANTDGFCCSGIFGCESSPKFTKEFEST